MAEGNGSEPHLQEEEDASNYQAPAMKTVAELKEMDKGDPSLLRLKEALLPPSVPVEPDNPKNVLVRTLTLLVEGRPDVTLDLTKDDISGLQLTIKEGSTYRLRIAFHVQREIVSGLKYVQRVYRSGVPVDKQSFMVGSYAPQNGLHLFLTPPEEAPSGLMGRGTYSMKSLFTDDDQNEWLKWEFKVEIKKNWD